MIIIKGEKVSIETNDINKDLFMLLEALKVMQKLHSDKNIDFDRFYQAYKKGECKYSLTSPGTVEESNIPNPDATVAIYSDGKITFI